MHSPDSFERVIQPGSIAAERLRYGHDGPLGSGEQDWDGNTVERTYKDLQSGSEAVAIQKLHEEMEHMNGAVVELVLQHIDPSSLRGTEMHFPKEK